MKEHGGMQPTTTSHIGCTQLAIVDHDGGKISTSENKAGGKKEREEK